MTSGFLSKLSGVGGGLCPCRIETSNEQVGKGLRVRLNGYIIFPRDYGNVIVFLRESVFRRGPVFMWQVEALRLFSGSTQKTQRRESREV